MKKYYLNAPQNPMVTDHSTLAEMVLDKALRDFQKERLLKEIDYSLETKNKEVFIRLTEELQKYLE
ncbi:IDEAL domain-containing protein [Niallia sp. XMNu-256]|uniref:IDEAL domain-containing protein n=1 Tax=Niallia sp. XMNu-256 TaxID=3082444 RepID=UPI0030CE7D07